MAVRALGESGRILCRVLLDKRFMAPDTQAVHRFPVSWSKASDLFGSEPDPLRSVGEIGVAIAAYRTGLTGFHRLIRRMAPLTSLIPVQLSDVTGMLENVGGQIHVAVADMAAGGFPERDILMVAADATVLLPQTAGMRIMVEKDDSSIPVAVQYQECCGVFRRR